MVNEKVNIENFLIPRNAHQLVSMRGEMDWSNTSSVMLDLNEKLKNLFQISLRKKVLKIATEMLDNLVKYNLKDPPDVFMVLHTESNLYFLSQNTISNKDLTPILEKIFWVNDLDKKGIDAEYLSQLKENELNDIGGAGLGIIEMARKSDNPIEYNAQSKDTKMSFLSILVTVTI